MGVLHLIGNPVEIGSGPAAVISALYIKGSFSQAILSTEGKVTVLLKVEWEGEPENRESQKTCLWIAPSGLRIKKTGCSP